MRRSPLGQLTRAVVLLLTTGLCWSGAIQPWSVCQSLPLEDDQLGPIFADVRGKVVVVALLQANWSSCMHEILRLNALRNKLHGSGLKDVEFIGINSKDHQSSLNALKNHSAFPIYQSNHNNRLLHRLGGHKRDVLIFDRCGRMTFYVSHPKSSVQFSYVEITVKSTYFDNPCGICENMSRALLEQRDSTEQEEMTLQCRCVKNEDVNRACVCKMNKQSCLCNHSPLDFKGRCSCHEKNGHSKSCFCRHDSFSLSDQCKCNKISCPNETETSHVNVMPLKLNPVSSTSDSEPSWYQRFASYVYDKFTDLYNLFTGKNSETTAWQKQDSDLSWWWCSPSQSESSANNGGGSSNNDKPSWAWQSLWQGDITARQWQSLWQSGQNGRMQSSWQSWQNTGQPAEWQTVQSEWQNNMNDNIRNQWQTSWQSNESPAEWLRTWLNGWSQGQATQVIWQNNGSKQLQQRLWLRSWRTSMQQWQSLWQSDTDNLWQSDWQQSNTKELWQSEWQRNSADQLVEWRTAWQLNHRRQWRTLWRDNITYSLKSQSWHIVSWRSQSSSWQQSANWQVMNSTWQQTANSANWQASSWQPSVNWQVGNSSWQQSANWQASSWQQTANWQGNSTWQQSWQNANWQVNWQGANWQGASSRWQQSSDWQSANWQGSNSSSWWQSANWQVKNSTWQQPANWQATNSKWQQSANWQVSNNWQQSSSNSQAKSSWNSASWSCWANWQGSEISWQQSTNWQSNGWSQAWQSQPQISLVNWDWDSLINVTKTVSSWQVSDTTNSVRNCLLSWRTANNQTTKWKWRIAE